MSDFSETLEEKVERLEYYIDLLRDYIVDQEHFIFWDWAISHRLNREEVRAIIDVAKEYNMKLLHSNEDNQDLSLEAFTEEIKKILTVRRSDASFEVDKKFVLQMIRRLSNMKICNQLADFYLKGK
ncbi:hypothetical protein PRECH8_03360 [Insulibacter thermoxylanivorax]|jgi:hypothetical protein|uniref:Uncharacterized protein n=1 Tax=Insulibacter thermoxylanivorax TaxID=2749268 RepID=A0A916VFY9_9BACL|nr:DUF1878 family protein [Insulibacter thermoxylanivorax]GFR37040.1 hypothetical protein PRECH8_03360 [Insulibacter thermoxylanivorax]